MEDEWSFPDVSAAPREVASVRESLVVLTHDEDLLQTLRAVATEHDISTIGAETDLAAHLLDDHAGVAILDTAAITSPIAQLTARLKAQFPELVLVVAGGGADQGAVAGQVTNGTVYRFFHKPLSEQRVRLFVNAAWRRHGEEHAGIAPAEEHCRGRFAGHPCRGTSRLLWRPNEKPHRAGDHNGGNRAAGPQHGA